VNVDLYKVLVKELARTLDIQSASNPEVQAAGMVINTMVSNSYLSIWFGFSNSMMDHMNSLKVDINVNNVFDP
jgi:hypothetical protein